MTSNEAQQGAAPLREQDVLRLLRESCRQAGTPAAWGRLNGVSPQYLNDVMKRARAPGDKILRALGLQKAVSYVPREPEPVELEGQDGEVLVRGWREFA